MKRVAGKEFRGQDKVSESGGSAPPNKSARDARQRASR